MTRLSKEYWALYVGITASLLMTGFVIMQLATGVKTPLF